MSHTSAGWGGHTKASADPALWGAQLLPWGELYSHCTLPRWRERKSQKATKPIHEVSNLMTYPSPWTPLNAVRFCSCLNTGTLGQHRLSVQNCNKRVLFCFTVPSLSHGHTVGPRRNAYHWISVALRCAAQRHSSCPSPQLVS